MAGLGHLELSDPEHPCLGSSINWSDLSARERSLIIVITPNTRASLWDCLLSGLLLQPLAPARDRLDLMRGEVGGETERERAA